MKSLTCRYTSLLLLAITSQGVALAADKPEAPYVNPSLAASPYPIYHAFTDLSQLAGPVGPSRRLRADEIQWKSMGPINGYFAVYSRPYPNGKRVVWVGGTDRIQKLDADTLDVLATYATGGTYMSDEEAKNHIAAMDRLDPKAVAEYNLKLWAEPAKNLSSVYHLLSKDNEYYLPYRGSDGSLSLRAYGEADATNPASKILLLREWKLPAEISKANIVGVNMTSNGWLVVVTQDGAMIALSRDFTSHNSVKLPSKHEEGRKQDFFSGFVRNGISTDDQGGIYVVTRDNLHRVQWTSGNKLSLDEADGAWAMPYPNEIERGSGTTPAPMGWGPKEDHLVLIADGSRGNKAMAFWRDAIPADWNGLPGYDRRVAGVLPIHFGVSKDEHPELENAAVVYGYGAFFNATYPEHSLPDQVSADKRWIVESTYMNIPGHEASGGTVIRWDPKERVLKQAWQTQVNFVSSVCSISGPKELLYCWGARNGEWTLEGTDWNTGKSVFHYSLGKSQRFNPIGAVLAIPHNGQIEWGGGGLGFVRVTPKPDTK